MLFAKMEREREMYTLLDKLEEEACGYSELLATLFRFSAPHNSLSMINPRVCLSECFAFPRINKHHCFRKAILEDSGTVRGQKFHSNKLE